MRRLPVIDRCDAPTLKCSRHECRMHLRGRGRVKDGFPRAMDLCVLVIAAAGPWTQETIGVLCRVKPQTISAAEIKARKKLETETKKK